MKRNTTTRPDAARQSIAAAQIPEAHLRLEVVTQLTGISASTIRRKMAEGAFPQPVRHGRRCTRWIAGQITEWLRKDQAAT